jgi:hypothetical protein
LDGMTSRVESLLTRHGSARILLWPAFDSL